MTAGSKWRDADSFVKSSYTPPAGVDPARSVFVLPVGGGQEAVELGDSTFDGPGAGPDEVAETGGQRRRLQSRAASTKTGVGRPLHIPADRTD